MRRERLGILSLPRKHTAAVRGGPRRGLPREHKAGGKQVEGARLPLCGDYVDAGEFEADE